MTVLTGEADLTARVHNGSQIKLSGFPACTKDLLCPVSTGVDNIKYAVTRNSRQSGGEPNRVKRDYIQQGNIQVRWRNHCGRGKAVSLVNSESVFVAVVIHYVLRMRRIVCLLSFVAYLALRHF